MQEISVYNPHYVSALANEILLYYILVYMVYTKI